MKKRSNYCENCKQVVIPKRFIGLGTIIMLLITGFFWLFFIPFYKKRCPICRANNFFKFSKQEELENHIEIKVNRKEVLNKNKEYMKKYPNNR